MPRIHELCLATSVLAVLVGCAPQEPQRTTQIIVQPPAGQVPTDSLVAPGPPAAAR